MSGLEGKENRFPSIADYQWGEVSNGLQVGFWVSATFIETGGAVDARAVVRNLSNRRIRLGSEFGLVIEGEGKTAEDFSGPRSGSTTWLKPGEFREVIGWRVSEQINRQVGVYRCSAVYRRAKGGNIQSALISIETKPSLR